MRRVNTLGIRQANKCMLMAAVAQPQKITKMEENKSANSCNGNKKDGKKSLFLLFGVNTSPDCL